MEDIYKEQPSMEKDKDIINPLIERLNGKTLHECKEIFNFVLHVLETEAILKTSLS